MAALVTYETLHHEVGPFVFEFLPDGDDPGIGALFVGARAGVTAQTAFDVTRVDWDAFVEATS